MTDPPDVAACQIRTRASPVRLVAVDLGLVSMEPSFMPLTIKLHQNACYRCPRDIAVIAIVRHCGIEYPQHREQHEGPYWDRHATGTASGNAEPGQSGRSPGV